MMVWVTVPPAASAALARDGARADGGTGMSPPPHVLAAVGPSAAGADPLLQRAVGLVHRDPVEPGEVAGLTAEPGDAPPGAQHDLLGHILGFGAVAEQPVQQHEQAIGVRAGEPLERGLVARLGASEQ